MSNIDLAKLRMPAVTEQGRRVLEMVKRPDTSLLALAEFIAQDPHLTATVLRYANAPLYRRHIETTNVRNAVSLLGINNVQLAVVVAAMRSYDDVLTPEMGLLFDHCQRIAHAMRLIAMQCAPFQADDMELTGIMHDMGALVLAANAPGPYRRVAAALLTAHGEIDAVTVEREILGLTRVEVMEHLAQVFRLPAVVAAAVARYFGGGACTPGAEPEARHAMVLALAHLLVAEQEAGAFTRDPVPCSVDDLQRVLALKAEQVAKIRRTLYASA